MNGPSYRPNKRPGRAVPQATTNDEVASPTGQTGGIA